MQLKVTADTLTQGQLEAFIAEYGKGDGLPSANGRAVRAACTAGWIDGKADDVPTLPAKLVGVLSVDVMKVFDGATNPDPKA